VIFDSWTDFIVLILAVAFAATLRYATATSNVVAWFITVGLALLCVFLFLIVGPHMAIAEGIGFVIWGIIDLFAYSTPIYSLAFFILAGVCFAVGHHYSY
jgi:hypothetical protein